MAILLRSCPMFTMEATVFDSLPRRFYSSNSIHTIMLCSAQSLFTMRSVWPREPEPSSFRFKKMRRVEQFALFRRAPLFSFTLIHSSNCLANSPTLTHLMMSSKLHENRQIAFSSDSCLTKGAERTYVTSCSHGCWLASPTRQKVPDISYGLFSNADQLALVGLLWEIALRLT